MEAKRRARAAGLDERLVERITGHSFRAGGVTDYLLAGFGAEFIMRQGHWLSTAFRVYFRLSQAALGAMSAQVVVAMAQRTAAYPGVPAPQQAASRALFQ